MSKIKKEHVFTSESVSEGHPDKMCDKISDAVLDACLLRDPTSRVACETMATHNTVINGGEVTCAGWEDIDTEQIVRDVVSDIGYTDEKLHFYDKGFIYHSYIHGQSPNISQGVTVGEGLDKDQGAGDQGMMFGYASDDTEELMPAPIAFSNRLLNHLVKVRKSGKIAYLRPDSKSQVSVLYKDGGPQKIINVVISHQTDDVPLDEIRKDVIAECREVLEPTGLLTDDTEFYINPTGSFVLGGPYADCGLTGRKIIVDTYGGVGSHGGGAFSGKDPSKVDRTAAYYSRYATKNIVAAGLARQCEIQVAYAIGISHPLSINVETYGTGTVEDEDIQAVLEGGDIFDFRPSAMVAELELLKPLNWKYADAAAGGHFGRAQFPWERTDKVEILKSHFNL